MIMLNRDGSLHEDTPPVSVSVFVRSSGRRLITGARRFLRGRRPPGVSVQARCTARPGQTASACGCR